MKKTKLKTLAVLALVLLMTSSAFAQDDKGYVFTSVTDLAATSVKNQYRSGTCWSFSGISYLESELLRLGKGEFDLSEMYIVRCTYIEKAKKYVRMHGTVGFAGGGQFHDILNMIESYGIMLESDYPGIQGEEKNHIHGEMDAVLKAYVDAVIKNKNKKLTNYWLAGFEGILDAYLGPVNDFDYKGKSYNPKSFANEVIGLNMSDYVNISSYTHHPFYTKFGIEIQDNWAWGQVYNVPINELMEIVNYSFDKGYTVAWATDVSEKGFSWPNGIAVASARDYEELEGMEEGKWSDMNKTEKEAYLYNWNAPGPEKEVTQEMRQLGFDNYQTTDDHGMHFTGIAKDQNGSIYYITKNSWGTKGKYDGYLYASEAFVKYKTMCIMVHKDSVPKKIAKKLNF
ncbi:MAG: aminopeptidase [Bacteroidetes bacterium]|nr:aminopeptidase [Bacteroidota bacterium]